MGPNELGFESFSFAGQMKRLMRCLHPWTTRNPCIFGNSALLGQALSRPLRKKHPGPGLFITVIALVAFALTSWAQHTNTHARGADAAQPATSTINGRTLFLKNCAHCHGATAHGDDGPDLHNLGSTDDWIADRIRRGKAGQMTGFAGKLQPGEIAALVAYVQSLK